MKLIQRLICVALAGLLFGACAKDGEVDTTQYENMSLEAWMTQHRPDLKDNFQEAGKSGYYVDVIDEGDLNAKPLGEDSLWVRFNVSARDLKGNIVLTRNADEAKLLNTFTKYTRYVPYFRYCGAENSGLLEGMWLAMRNPLTIKGRSEKVRLRINSVVDLYIPSFLIGGSVEGSGGYEGETSLASGRPMILRMEITDTVKNPLSSEGREVDEFCTRNGGLLRYIKPDPSSIGGTGDSGVEMPTDVNDFNHAYNTPERWVSACDSVAQLYVNYRFNPADAADLFTYEKPYTSYAPYDNVAALDRKIAAALVKRFHTDKESTYPGIPALAADSVGLDGTAKIWYIGRFLDGFIFDTNIDEVKELIYDSDYTSGSALSYTPSSGGLIQAFYYTIPHMQYGQWGELITVSTNGYGSTGQTGSSTVSSSGDVSSSYYDYMNYLNYINSYYSGYYGGYYNNYYGSYYGGYYGGYYDNYYTAGSTTTTTTTTTVTTEIPSFCPLIFQFYIEPKSN